MVGDVRRVLVASAWQQAPALYLPAAQTHPANVHYVLRFAGIQAGALAREAERVVQQVDPLQPIWDVETMPLRQDSQLWREKAVTHLVSVFAVAAVLLAVGGLYAVLVQTLRHRRHEIGVRMALGADSGTIANLMLAAAGRVLLPALALGGLATIAVFRWLASLVPFFGAPSALSLAGTGGGLAALTLLAVLVPAWRAAKVRPSIALREP